MLIQPLYELNPILQTPGIYPPMVIFSFALHYPMKSKPLLITENQY